jgi:mxaA protein
MNRCSRFRGRRAIRCAAFLVVLLAWPALSQAQAILANEVIEPRTFGYVVGDKIRRELRLTLSSGYRLDEASLPEAGRLDRWLEVAAPEVRGEPIDNGRSYRVILTYQVFNAPQSLETVTIPQQDFRLVADAGEPQALTTLIPALRITVAPLTSAISPDRLSVASLQEDRPPPPVPTGARQSRVTWTLAVLLALLLYAGWRRGTLAFLARASLPFAKAVRELQGLQAAAGTAAESAAALKIVHEAVNRTAGRAVFAHNVDDFLATHPAYAVLRDEFHQLFTASGRVFFSGAPDDVPPGADLPRLLRLCRRCRSIERQLFVIREAS